MVSRSLKVIQAHVSTRSEVLKPEGVTDPRLRKGRYSLASVWRTMVMGFCAMVQSARKAEEVFRHIPVSPGPWPCPLDSTTPMA